MSQQNSKNKEKKELKRDRKLFAQLFIAAQVKMIDVQELFEQETRRESPVFTKKGDILSGNQADLIPCLKDDRNFPTT